MIQLPRIPPTLPPEAQRYLRDLSLALTHELERRIPKDVAVGSVLLASPAGKVYTVRVADDGTLETALVNE